MFIKHLLSLRYAIDPSLLFLLLVRQLSLPETGPFQNMKCAQLAHILNWAWQLEGLFKAWNVGLAKQNRQFELQLNRIKLRDICCSSVGLQACNW